MVKPNAQHDYYHDLELSQKAEPDEIKKQYFKLARLYHPDRNPGRVEEYTPKFQAIQEAHEVLSDPATKAKYDADRARIRTTLNALKTNVGPARRGGAYNSTRSDFTAPRPGPRRAQFQRPEAPPDFAAKPSNGANRFNAFKGAPTPTPPHPSSNAAAKASAWARMSGAGKPMAPGSSDKSWESDADSSRRRPTPPRPGAFGRANTTRPPPTTSKSGFDPRATDGQFEPAVTGAANYFTQTRFSDRPPPATADPEPHHSSQASEADGIRVNGAQDVQGNRARSSSNVAFTEGEERVAAPYRKSGGERVRIVTDDLRRSTSVRDAPAYAKQAERNFSPQSSTSSRHRSVSPPRRSYFDHPPQNMPGFTHMGAHTAKEKMKASDPRRFFDIAYSDSSDESDLRSPNSTTPAGRPSSDAQPRAPPLFGERPIAQSRPPFSRTASRQPDETGSTSAGGTSTPVVGNNVGTGTPPIFKIPAENPTLNSPRFSETRSRSEENINTKFSQANFDGSFKGGDSYFSATPANVPDPKARRSPRGRQGPRAVSEAQSQPASDTAPKQFDAFPGLGTMPPPPPPLPKFPPMPAGAHFTKEQWAQQFSDASWVFQPERSGSPTKGGPASSRKGSTSSTASRTRPGSRVSAAGRPPKTPTVAEDAGSTTGYDGEESTTSRNSDAMDIDDAPQTNGSTPLKTPRVRNVSQQPQRTDWREKASGGPVSPVTPVAATSADAMNLNGLDKVAPFGIDPGAPGDGLTNLNDLGTGLPVASATSKSHPLKPTEPRTFELPLMPKAPDVPSGRMTTSAWNEYVASFAKYMRAWFGVQKQMQSHFDTRRKEMNNTMINATSKPGGMDSWLNTFGEAKDEIGLASYLRILQEEERVREHWNVVCDAHREAVEAFSSVKDRILQNGFAEAS